MTYEEWKKDNYMCVDIDDNAREIWNAALDSAAEELEKKSDVISLLVAAIKKEINKTGGNLRLESALEAVIDTAAPSA